MTSSPEIVCIGGANVDQKAVCAELIHATSNPARFHQRSAGGVARNVAENLARLGTAVSLITFVGQDQEADWLLAQCRAAGIDVSGSQPIASARTGAYLAVLDPQGELQFALADMGIYDRVSWEMVGRRWPLIGQARIVFADSNLPASVLAALVARAQQKATALVLDCVSVSKSRKLPRDLHGCRLLVANRDEARALAGGPAGLSGEDWGGLARAIRDRGAQQVVITLGAEGAYFQGGDHGGQCPALPAQVVDVTGAGDSFCAGLLHGLLRGCELDQAVAAGQRAARLTLATPLTVSPAMRPGCLEALEQPEH